MTYRKIVVDAILTVLLVGLCLLLYSGYETRQWMQRESPKVESALSDIQATVAESRAKVQEIDVRAVNGSIRNVRTATGHANAILADVHGNMPKINKGAFYLWKHADRTLGHLDAASADYTDRQNEIALQTVATLKDLDNLLSQAQPTIAHVNSFTEHADATAAHVEHVAEHYDKRLTAPKRWWQKLKDAGNAVAIWCARHI